LYEVFAGFVDGDRRAAERWAVALAAASRRALRLLPAHVDRQRTPRS